MKKFIEMFKNAPRAKVTKLAFAFVGVLVSGAILIAAATSMAWFSNNHKSDGRQMALEAQNDGTSLSYEVYKSNSAGTEVEKITSLDTEIVMNTHDAVFLSENRYNPIFLRIGITTENTNLTNGTATFSISRSSTDHELTKYLSTVGRFACSASVNYDGASTNLAIYTAALNYFCNNNGTLKTPASSAMFISGSAGNYTKQATITLPAVEVDVSEGASTTFYLTLCICYDTSYSNWLAYGDTFRYLDADAQLFNVEDDLSSITVVLS